MGSKITRLTPMQGFCAETGGAITLFGATYLGIPVSTTHTITGSIVGVGAARKVSAVRWNVATNIVIAWVITLPASALIAAFFYLLSGLGSMNQEQGAPSSVRGAALPAARRCRPSRSCSSPRAIPAAGSSRRAGPAQGLAARKSAAREAREEGGLVGRIGDRPIGRYHYDKRLPDGSSVPCSVEVFALEVERQLKSWPERKERRTRWFVLQEAADAVEEPELAAMIRDLPKRLARSS